MPEQITKYPDVTLKVLKEAGARCGEGVEQKILTKCPPAQFCSLSSGEICVYGINQIPKMTQIDSRDLQPVVCPSPFTAGASQGFVGTDIALLGVALVVGAVSGGVWRRIRKR